MPDNFLIKITIQGYSNNVVFSNLRLEQHMGDHHYFKFTWSATNFVADTQKQLNTVQSYLGKPITISFKNNDQENDFDGLITSISVDEKLGSTQSFTVEGYSPTILLEDTPKCSSYCQKNLNDIINAVLTNIPQQTLPTNINPANTDSLLYIVQYNETDFKFIQRLSRRFGEWFYYDGKTMYFGDKGQPDCDDLTRGYDLKSFRLTAKIKGLDLTFSGFDPVQGAQLSDTLPTVNGSGHNYHNPATDASNNVFSRQDSRVYHTPIAHNQRLLNNVKSVQNDAAASDLVEYIGNSTNVTLKVGYDVPVNNPDGSLDNKYSLLSVIHYSSGPFNYSNNFIAIPSSIKVHPYTNPFLIAKCETQTATVVKNADSHNLGRVKVQFPWQINNDTTPWIRMVQPHAGDSKGFYFIPEIGEEVLVAFEDGNVEKPLVVGTGYNGSAKPASNFISSSNYYKVIQTVSNHTIFFSDDPNNQTLLIANDSNKNQILLDFTNNQIIIKSQGDIHIQADQNIEIKAGQDINITADGNINVQAQQQMQLQSSQAMQLSTDDQYSLQATNGISINSDQGITMESVMDTDITADNNLSLEGTIQASVQGTQVQIEGDAMTTIDGAMVMINS